jgi:hypothetical protein
MRRADDQLVTVCVSPAEQAAIAALSAAGGFSSPGNTIRAALWSLGDELGLTFADGVFDFRLKTGGRATATRPTRSKPSIARRHVPPSASHPWRHS